MASDVTDDDITIVDTKYNIQLKDAISQSFILQVTHPNTLMRVLQKYNKDVLTHEDIDYVKTLFRNNGPMAANEALVDRIYRYKNWFQCLLQAVNDDSIKLGFLEKEFQACKDDLDEQILSETNEEKTNSSRHPDNRIPVSQRRENLRLKLNIEKLKKQQEDHCNYFEIQMKDLQKELQLLKEFSANQKEEQSRRLEKEKEELQSEVKELKEELGELTLCHEQLKKEFIQEKSSHDELKILVEEQANENMEREKKSTEILDTRFQSLNMEKEELNSKVKLLTQQLGIRQFLHLNPDAGTCHVSEQWKRIHHSGLTLLFIGYTGHGKSETGNTILGRRAFDVNGGYSTRYHVGIECCKYKGLNLKLIDGPGYFDTQDGDFFYRFISNIGETLGHGVDVFIYVSNYSVDCEQKQRNSIELLKEIFGVDFLKNFCVVLFTYGDHLDPKRVSLSEYCSLLKRSTIDLINECGGAVLFDNTTSDVNVKETQMESLLHLIAKKISHRKLSGFKIPSELIKKKIRPPSPDENE